MKCEVDECENDVKTKNLCVKHYHRMRRSGRTYSVYKERGTHPPCKVHDCEAGARSQGFCHRHYARYRKYGDPDMTKTYFTRYYDTETRLRGMVKSWAGCWSTGDKNQYGKITINYETRYAHRLAYELWVGPIGDGYIIHKCNNRSCINPKHLLLSTQRVNMVHRTLKPRSVRKVEDEVSIL